MTTAWQLTSISTQDQISEARTGKSGPPLSQCVTCESWRASGCWIAEQVVSA
jgi:hypothetical protein